MIDELDAETKAKLEKEIKRIEHIVRHGNRIQKISLVWNMAFAFEVISNGHAWFKYSFWQMLYSVMRENFRMTKLIWERKVLA